jgi:hypothetical protein
MSLSYLSPIHDDRTATALITLIEGEETFQYSSPESVSDEAFGPPDMKTFTFFIPV